MKNKKILIILGTILLIVAVIIVKIAIDFSKENKIKKEVQTIISLLEDNPNNTDKINNILNRTIIKKGKYNKVEQGIKEYYKNLYQNYSNLLFVTDTNSYKTYLEANYIKENKPSFINTKKTIENTSDQIIEQYNKVNNYIKDNSIKIPFITKYDLNTYYKDFYLSLIDNYITEDFIKNITHIKDNSIKQLTTYEEAINYLIAHENKWYIKSNSLVFKDVLNNEEYNSIINSLKED